MGGLEHLSFLSFEMLWQIPDQGFRQRKEGAAHRQSLRNFILIPRHAGRGDLRLLPRQYGLIKLVYTPHYPVSDSRSS